MNTDIKSTVYVLGDNIDTDQIIPAAHLAISLSDPSQRARYGGLALSGVPAPQAGLPTGNMPFSNTTSNRSQYKIIIAGKNFGCGSSREHAPVALYEAGVRAIIARSYARIFYRNAIDGGYFPPLEIEADLTSTIATGDSIHLDWDACTCVHLESGRRYDLKEMGAAKEIIMAGGLFPYYRSRGGHSQGGP
ncbi:MAG: 3-isopropylmalate dehydratase [Myxococcota bacterium]|nr:3-isopropylmalate dehydratase [Myxococcota bacterium]